MLSDPRGPHCDGLRVCFMHACTLLAIIDPFKPCPGTVDGINFANLRRWMNSRNFWSVRSSRPPVCKVESWLGATAWPGWGRFERNKFRKSSYRNVRQLCTWGRGGHAFARSKSCVTACAWWVCTSRTPSAKICEIYSVTCLALIDKIQFLGKGAIEPGMRSPFPAPCGATHGARSNLRATPLCVVGFN